MIRFFKNSLITPILKFNYSFLSNFSAIKPANFTKFSSELQNISSTFPLFSQNRFLFIYRSGDLLWEGVTGAPGRAKKRARGKRRVVRNKVDLNIGRKVGENKMNYKYPGLNSPIFESKEVLRRTIGEKDNEVEKTVFEMRNRQSKKRFNRSVEPLKRGWSGGNMGGQSVGKPEPVIGHDWEGFDSRILELKIVTKMTATKGRFGRFSAVVMVGNGQGLAGVGKGKSTNLRSALKIAKKKATQHFEFYKIRESRTLWHTDFIHDWSTDLFVRPMPEGYGLVCHRLIKTMCELIGIKDLFAKVEGSVSNYQVIIRAFKSILRKQESYQDLANRMQLNVVEFRTESDNYPKLLAAPSNGVTRTPDPEEDLDFNRLHTGGQVFQSKPYTPPYLNLPGPVKKAHERYRYRNLNEVERSRRVLNYLADEGHLAKIQLTDANKK